MPEELDVVFEAALQKALNFLSERGFNRELRQEQKSSVKQLFTGGDLVAVLPTGFGKSLIVQLLALVNDDHVVLVICPLKSIVNDQIKEASSMGISAGSLSDCLQTDIVSGKYRLLFAEKATRFTTISLLLWWMSSKCHTICSCSFNFDIAFLNATCAKNKVINYGTENSEFP